MTNRAVLLCALALPGLATAADGDQWYIAPFFGGVAPDHARDVDHNDIAYGAAVGRELGPVFNIELSGNATDPNTRSPLPPGHLNLDALSLDVLAVGNRAGWVSPYLGAGFGAVRTNYRFDGGYGPGYDTRLGIETEAGLMIKLWESPQRTSKISLRPEVKLRWAHPGSENLEDFFYTVGVQFAFGGSPVPVAVPVAAAPPPPPPPAPPPPPPPPPAPAPAPAPQAQFVAKSSITLEGVNFAFNSAELTQDSKPILDATADGLKAHPRVKVEVQGHTDSVGKAAYNLKLSQRRAQSVLDYLLKDGVAPDQMVAKGYGETQPVASNKDADGRAKNRRVVLYVLSNPGDVNVKGQGTSQDQPQP
ncbi:MAG TPA: OmpA family protein [Steroidobacteraceae bacterium]|nr:OmpA family protein [Steroidobacteraceae bacterium]